MLQFSDLAVRRALFFHWFHAQRPGTGASLAHLQDEREDCLPEAAYGSERIPE
jgi:hypothetical protein